MAINFNRTNIENVIFNNQQVEKVIMNGILVWENWKELFNQYLYPVVINDLGTNAQWYFSSLDPKGFKLRKVIMSGSFCNRDGGQSGRTVGFAAHVKDGDWVNFFEYNAECSTLPWGISNVTGYNQKYNRFVAQGTSNPSNPRYTNWKFTIDMYDDRIFDQVAFGCQVKHAGSSMNCWVSDLIIRG